MDREIEAASLQEHGHAAPTMILQQSNGGVHALRCQPAPELTLSILWHAWSAWARQAPCWSAWSAAQRAAPRPVPRSSWGQPWSSRVLLRLVEVEGVRAIAKEEPGAGGDPRRRLQSILWLLCSLVLVNPWTTRLPCGSTETKVRATGHQRNRLLQAAVRARLHGSVVDLKGTVGSQLDFGQFRQPPGERYLAGKWIRREFCHCLGLAGTVKKLTRPIFDASNDL
jgi:hypothetical protein